MLGKTPASFDAVLRVSLSLADSNSHKRKVKSLFRKTRQRTFAWKSPALCARDCCLTSPTHDDSTLIDGGRGYAEKFSKTTMLLWTTYKTRSARSKRGCWFDFKWRFDGALWLQWSYSAMTEFVLMSSIIWLGLFCVLVVSPPTLLHTVRLVTRLHKVLVRPGRKIERQTYQHRTRRTCHSVTNWSKRGCWNRW